MTSKHCAKYILGDMYFSNTRYDVQYSSQSYYICITVDHTLCLQPASLNGQSTIAVLHPSFTCAIKVSRVIPGVPHLLGHCTGKRGHCCWWGCEYKTHLWMHSLYHKQNINIIKITEKCTVCVNKCWKCRMHKSTDLNSVIEELFFAVSAGQFAFGTLWHSVLGQQSPHHTSTTFILTVHTLLRTIILVTLNEDRDGCVRAVVQCWNEMDSQTMSFVSWITSRRIHQNTRDIKIIVFFFF